MLIRETVIRWNKGFASVLVLAAGYGMLCEAIDTKGFFDPHFYAVVGSGLEGFGRSFGINVPWAINISIFHAVFSMIVPLIIVSAIFQSSKPWIGKSAYAALLIAVIACSAFSFEVVSLAPDYYHYSEGPGPIILILALMTALIILAWRLPNRNPQRWPVRVSALALFILGCAYTIAFYFARLVQTATGSPGIYIAFLLVFYVALPLLLILKLQKPTERERVALAAGLLMPLMVAGAHGGAGSLVAVGVLLTLIAAAFWRNRLPTLPAAPSSTT